jgi:flavin-dependent dehydrogenase
MKVRVIGASPSGLFAVYLLAKGGLEVKVYERMNTLKLPRTRGLMFQHVINELRRYLLGWQAHFGLSEAKSVFEELDSWIHRRLRCYLWKQWGRGR